MTKRILATWILLSFATAASGDWVYVDACGMGCCPQMVWQNTPQPAALRFVPTPHSVVERALQIAAPTRSDVIYDLGCGDARVLIAACREYRCAGLGVEIDAETAAIAKTAVTNANCSRSIRILHADATKLCLDGGDVIYLYLEPKTIAALHPSLSEARMVLSYMHDVPQLDTQKIEWTDGGKHRTLYVYVNE